MYLFDYRSQTRAPPYAKWCRGDEERRFVFVDDVKFLTDAVTKRLVHFNTHKETQVFNEGASLWPPSRSLSNSIPLSRGEMHGAQLRLPYGSIWENEGSSWAPTKRSASGGRSRRCKSSSASAGLPLLSASAMETTASRLDQKMNTRRDTGSLS